MSSKSIISADNLSLVVPSVKTGVSSVLQTPLKLIFGFYTKQTQRHTRTILSNVSFELKAGERLGIMGVNGAGKTSLLRLICGSYSPSKGDIDVAGDIQALFNIQLGMNQKATGLENIYLRGLQMGMNLKEIREVIPEVIEFSGLQDSIQNIYSSFSTGMRLRLAVSISLMKTPDILVMDEWIGSGDKSFTQKLNKKLLDVVDQSRTMVIATHNQMLMKRLCTHGMVLHEGRCAYYGGVNDAIEYLNTVILNRPVKAEGAIAL